MSLNLCFAVSFIDLYKYMRMVFISWSSLMLFIDLSAI